MLLATSPVNPVGDAAAVATLSSNDALPDGTESLPEIAATEDPEILNDKSDQSAEIPIPPVAAESSEEIVLAGTQTASIETEANGPEERKDAEQAGADEIPESDPSVIVVTGRFGPPPGDPLESINATTYGVTQSVDKAIIGPVAMAYDSEIPEPIRDGIGNFLSNLREPLVFLNFLLQLKPGKAAETFGRFAVNSTIGVAGLFDAAKKKPFNLPRRSNGFADTMGYYGVKPGAFLFLPILGPTTIRDAIGGGLDGLLLPTAVGSPFNKLTYNIPTGALNSLGERADFDEQLQKIRDESDDPYTAAREYYLAHRQAEIDVLRGRRASVDSPLYETADTAPETEIASDDAAEADQEPRVEPLPDPETRQSEGSLPNEGETLLSEPLEQPEGQ